MNTNAQVAHEAYSDEVNQVCDVCLEEKPELQLVRNEPAKMGLCMSCDNFLTCKLPGKGKGIFFCEEFA